jgi:hypothetical protein
MPVDIDFLSGFYNRHSCYADRLTADELEMIHVPTSVEAPLKKWIKSKTDLVITGNPGDGKTFLLRRLATEIAKVNGDQILDATAEKDYSSIVSGWQKARRAKRPFFLAINHGPLNRMLQLHASGNPILKEVQRQLSSAIFYGSTEPAAPNGVVVLDLNLRSVLSREIIETSLNNLLRDAFYSGCEYFQDATTCGSRNRHALQSASVRERLIELLAAAGHTTRHISMRDLQGFLSYLVFGGASCAELGLQEREGLPHRYFNLCFSGDGELFRAVDDFFDPVRSTVPQVDEDLWENTGVNDGWAFSRPPLTPDHYDDAMDQFRAIKRQYFFEHRDGGNLLDMVGEDDKIFNDLVSSERPAEQKYLGLILQAINRFYCQSIPNEQGFLRLWGSQEYDTHTPPILVSCYRVEKHKFSLEVPQLAPWLRQAIQYLPGHILLRYDGDSGRTGLKIDRPLWKALMLASRGIPMALRSPQYSQLLQGFMTRLHRYEAKPAEFQSALVFNVNRGRTHQITVDRTRGRYTNS